MITKLCNNIVYMNQQCYIYHGISHLPYITCFIAMSYSSQFMLYTFHHSVYNML